MWVTISCGHTADANTCDTETNLVVKQTTMNVLNGPKKGRDQVLELYPE